MRREMAEISRQTGLLCSVAPITHSAQGSLWSDSLALLSEENANGARVYGQSMPRSFDMNLRLSESSFLLFALPAWSALMRLPLPERLAGFRDPARRAELRNQSVLLGPLLQIMEVGQTARPENAHLQGRNVADLAKAQGVTPADVLLDLSCSEGLETEFQMRNFLHADPEGVTAVLSHPWIHLGASDAGAHVSQFCGAGDTTFLLARWVRELRAFTLESAVHRLTGQLADDFGIRGRGRIAAGLAGDLVLFDPATIDRGEEEFIGDVPGGGNRYVRHARGIDAVLVNGALVWDGKGYTDARTGQIV